MAKLYKVDGTMVEVQPQNASDFSLEELHSLVDCDFIEIVHTSKGKLLVVDEEGKLKGKPINLKATILYGNPYDYIVGNALECNKSQIK